MAERDTWLKRHQVLADFVDLAIHSEDLDDVLTEGGRLVGEALGTDRAKILEITEGGAELFVRAGIGWQTDVVGKLRLPMSERSSESFSIEAGEPVLTQDIAHESRFDVPDSLKDAGVVAFVNVPIFVLGPRAYGVLQVDSDATISHRLCLDVTTRVRTRRRAAAWRDWAASAWAGPS